MHELLLRSSKDRRLATNRAATLLSNMPVSRPGLQPGPVPACFEPKAPAPLQC